jgi:hypothetical protein
MVWFAFILSCLWLVLVVCIALFALKIDRDVKKALNPVVAENAVLQTQIRDVMAWQSPHLCGLPRGDKANDAGVFDFGTGHVWQCPACGLRWVAVGFEAVNTLTRRIDWVTEYEATTGRRPIFDPRSRRKAVSALRPAGPAHRLGENGKVPQ